MGTRLFLSIIMIASNVLGAMAIEKENNLREGLRYVELAWHMHQPSQYRTFIIEGTEWIAEKEALQVWAVNTATNEKTGVAYYLYTEGSKVYQLGRRNTPYEDKWFLIYDFNLQPGEIMEGYSLGYERPLKFYYKCLERKPNPKYNNLTTITLSVADEESPDQWYVGALPEEWIVGIGSKCGLTSPGISQMEGNGGTNLMEVSEGEDILFTLFQDEVTQILDDTSSPLIFDLNGRVLPNDGKPLSNGIYLLKAGKTTKKIIVN